MLPLDALILITNGVLHSPVSGTRAVSLRRRSAGPEACSTLLSTTSLSSLFTPAAATATAAAAAAATTHTEGLSAATSLPSISRNASLAIPSEMSEAFGDEGLGLSPRAPTAHSAGGLADATAAAAEDVLGRGLGHGRSSEAEDVSPFDLTLAALGIEPGLLSAEDLAAALVVAVAGDGNQILLRAQSERERDEWVG